MHKLSQQPQQNLSNLPQSETNISNAFITQNNKKALELLLRIQSQLEASKVISTSTGKIKSYE